MWTSGNVDRRLSFLHYPPEQQQPTPQPRLRPPDKHNSIQSLIHHMGWLRTLHEVLHEVQTITIRFYDCNGEFIFVSGEIRTKMPQKPNYKSKKIWIFGENGINSKLKHRKANDSILYGRFGDPYGRPRDWCHIRETPG